jgi:hypothetical protein
MRNRPSQIDLFNKAAIDQINGGRLVQITARQMAIQ